MALHNSQFRAPEDPRHPVILVGPGTGLAPMMGFLQDRALHAQNGHELGPCCVFTGCRYRQDQIYAEQLRRLKNWTSAKGGGQVVTIVQVDPYIRCRVGNVVRAPNSAGQGGGGVRKKQKAGGELQMGP